MSVPSETSDLSKPQARPISVVTSPSQVAVVFLVALAASWLAFAQAVNSPLTLQDDQWLFESTLLRTGEGLEHLWRGIWPAHSLYPLPSYQPVASTTFWVDRQLWGEPSPPGTDGRGTLARGMHFTNLLIHALSTALLFGLLRRLHVPGAMLAALLFALHPVQAQVIAWVFARGYLLAMMFGLMATFPFLKWAGVGPSVSTLSEDLLGESLPKRGLAQFLRLPDEPWKQLAIAGVLFLAALGSHAAAACFPLVWLVIVWWKRPQASARVSLAVAAFLLPAVAAVRLWVNMGLDRAGVYTFRYDLVEGGVSQEAFARLGLAGAALAKYVQLVFLPFDLMPDHPRWNVGGVVQLAGWVSWLAVVGGTVLLVIWRDKFAWARHAIAAIAVTVVLLAPAVFLLDVPATVSGLIVERMSYFGVAALVTIFAAVAAKVAQMNQEFAGPATALASVLVAACVGGSFWHGKKYQSEGSAWSFGIQRNPESWMALTQGAAFHELRAKNLAGAFEVYSAALKIHPKDPIASLAIARLQAQGGQTAVAMSILDGLTRALPGFAEAHLLRGQLLQGTGDLSGAFDAFNAARQADPRQITARVRQAQLFLNAADMALAQGDREQVGERLRSGMNLVGEALRVNPLDSSALNVMGALFYANNQRSEALVAWEKARTVVPDDPVLANNLATLLIQVDQLEQAQAELERALKIEPQFAEALSNMGRLRLVQARRDEARKFFLQALAINPDLGSARRGLLDLDRPTTLPTTGPTTEPSGPSAIPPITVP